MGEILIRRHRNIDKWLEIAFWISLATGLIGALIVVALAPFANLFFKDGHGLTPLLLVAAIGLPFDAMAVISQSKLRIDLRFKTLAGIGTSAFLRRPFSASALPPPASFGPTPSSAAR